MKTLPDVVTEALAVLSQDFVLKRGKRELIEPIRNRLRTILNAQFRESDVRELEALGNFLERTYVETAVAVLRNLVRDEPRCLEIIDNVCGTLVSDLRARGWSDESLEEKFKALGTGPAALDAFFSAVQAPAVSYDCFVAVTLTSVTNELPSLDDFEVVNNLPQPVAGAPKKGPYLRIRVRSVDAHHAARVALDRAHALIGALEVFVSSDLAVRGGSIVTHNGHAYEVHTADAHLPRHPRGVRQGELRRIAAHVFDAQQFGNQDAVFDAMRHRAKALQTTDPENRFLLLWLGVERLVNGGPGGLIDTASQLIPKAIAIGKLRRDLGVIAAEIDGRDFDEEVASKLYEAVGLSHASGKRRVDRIKLGQTLLAEDAENRAFLSTFYEEGVRLVQWWWQLRNQLYPVEGVKVACYFEDSRQRHEWQVRRLYRARNTVAHGRSAPIWIGDLIRHAHFYLTELVAIAVHYRSQRPSRPAYDILAERAAQYDAFMDLLRSEVRDALRPSVLVRPTSLVGAS